MSRASCISYGDYTSLLTFSANVRVSSLALKKDNHWFATNNLRLNEDKTQNIIFSAKRYLMVLGKTVRVLGFIYFYSGHLTVQL